MLLKAFTLSQAFPFLKALHFSHALKLTQNFTIPQALNFLQAFKLS